MNIINLVTLLIVFHGNARRDRIVSRLNFKSATARRVVNIRVRHSNDTGSRKSRTHDKYDKAEYL